MEGSVTLSTNEADGEVGGGALILAGCWFRVV